VKDSLLRAFLFLPDLDGGGAQRTFVNLANALPDLGIETTVVAGRTDGPAKEWFGEQFSLIDLEAPRLRHAIGPLRKLLKSESPGILLSTLADANIAAWAASRYLPVRLILRETNSHRARDDISWWRRQLISLAYPRADAVVALSEGVRGELTADYAIDPTKCRTIHNPVDVTALVGALADGPDSPILGKGPMVLGVGRLTRQKHFDLLLRGVAALPDRSIQIALLGEGPDRTAILSLAHELGLSDRLIMPGFVSDLTPWLAHADIFVLSSLWEGFGHVIVEAMAAGLPVIATDCPHGPRDIIADGETGLLVPNDDASALAAAIASMLDDPDRKHALGRAGQIAAARFRPEKIAAEYAELIQQVATA